MGVETRVHSIKAGLSWCHLITSGSGGIIVDAGSPGKVDVISRALESTGEPLRLILITHAHMDHYGGAAELRRRSGAPVAIHRYDAAPMARGETPVGSVRLWGHLVKLALPLVERILRPEPTVADVLLDDGDRLEAYGIDGRIIHTPGHTRGSISVVLGDGTVFVSDLASSMGFPHAQMLYAQDWGTLRESLRRVQAVRPKRVFTGHGGSPIDGAVFRQLRGR